MTEIWKDIEGYEGLYQVSNCGRVKRLAGVVKGNWKQGERRQEERVLKPLHCRLDYQAVSLSKDGKMTHYLIHRLVAQAFIPNPLNLPEVNHKDEKPSNNCVDNLEWCDHIYNNNYGTKVDRQRMKISKPISQFTIDGDFIRNWASATEAANELGYDRSTISSVCKGEYKQAYGYKWSYRTA